MPSYKVLKQGFFAGRLYDPVGKRPVLHTEKPFPSKNKIEQVPSWLEPIEETTTAKTDDSSTGLTVKELKEKLTALDVPFKGNASKATLTELLETAEAAAKVQQDQSDIDNASFMGEGETSNQVETL